MRCYVLTSIPFIEPIVIIFDITVEEHETLILRRTTATIKGTRGRVVVKVLLKVGRALVRDPMK
jgi:hypothetical protein